MVENIFNSVHSFLALVHKFIVAIYGKTYVFSACIGAVQHQVMANKFPLPGKGARTPRLECFCYIFSFYRPNGCMIACYCRVTQQRRG